MSTKNKTSDKLVASIRKSKTGAVARKTAERPDVAKSAAKPGDSATRPASKAATNNKSPTSKAAATQDRQYTFNRGRRVWPD